MEITSQNENIQGVTSSYRSSTTTSTEAQATGFEALLRNIIAPESNSSINEEELFAALLEERIQSKVSAEAAEEFKNALSSHKGAMMRHDGYIPVEKAANAALDDLIASGTLTAADADDIQAQAFTAAQLDDNLTALYDGRGGGDDQTIATADAESALSSALNFLEQMESGTLTATTAGSAASAAGATSTTTTESTSSMTPTGNEIDGEGGFVFKPESESENKLVILLPAVYAQNVDDVLLKDEDGNILERGRTSGYANGGREHFRFNKSGQDYPENLTVEVRMTDGSIMTYEIPDPSERYD